MCVCVRENALEAILKIELKERKVITNKTKQNEQKLMRTTMTTATTTMMTMTATTTRTN